VAASILLGSALPVCPAIRAQSAQSAWYLSGRVILDAGWPPEDGADIVVTCNGLPYVAARTDKKGDFSFRLGANSNRAIEDASARSADGSFGRPSISMGPSPSGNTTQGSTTDSQQQTAGTTTATSTSTATPLGSGPRGSGERAFTRCELQAKLPGYKSPAVNLDNRRAMDNPNLGTIVLHRIGPVDEKPVSATALAAPKEAVKAFEKGREDAKARRPEEARKQFEKAVGLYPKYAAAWCELGKLGLERREMEDAQRMFEAGIKADPQYLDSYLDLATLQAAARRWPELAETTGAALHLDAHDYPQAYYLNALANFNTRNLDAAEKSAREAERLDPRRHFPGSWQVLGRILLIRRQFAEAAAQLREYLRVAPRAADAASVRSWLAEIERLSADSSRTQQN
jgi:tetratricopeptide (TPR) repeat protein